MSAVPRSLRAGRLPLRHLAAACCLIGVGAAGHAQAPANPNPGQYRMDAGQCQVEKRRLLLQRTKWMPQARDMVARARAGQMIDQNAAEAEWRTLSARIEGTENRIAVLRMDSGPINYAEN